MRCWASAVILVVVAGARAADPVVPAIWPVGEAKNLLAIPMTPEMRAQTQRLVKDLGSPDIDVRERASQELATKGAVAFPGLREAVLASKSDEATARAAPYVGEGKFLFGPYVPAGVVEMIKQYEEERARQMDLRAHAVHAPLWVTARIDGWDQEAGDLFFKFVSPLETDPSNQKMLSQQEGLRGPLKARLAIAAGRLDEAEGILRDAMGTPRNAKAVYDWVALRSLRMGDTLNPEKELAALKADGNAGDLVASLLYRANGDFGRAAEISARLNSDSSTPGEQLMVESENWSVLATFIEAIPNHYEADNELLMAYRMQGDIKRVNALVDMQAQSGRSKNLAPLYVLNDRAPEAIQWSIQSNDDYFSRFYLLCAQLRIREALASIKDRKSAPPELVGPLVDLGLDRAARDLLKEMAPSDTAGHEFPPRGYLFYAGAWERAGDPKMAEQWRDRGLDVLGPREIEHRRLLEESKSVEAAIKATKPQDPRYEDLARQRDKLRSQVSYPADPYESFVIGPYPPRDPTAQEEASYWSHLVMTREDGDPRTRYEKAERLARGAIAPAEVDSLVKEATENMTPWVGAARAEQLRLPVEQFHRWHHDDWALKLVNAAVDAQRDPGFWVLMGDLEMDNADWKAAADYYRRAAVLSLTDGSLAYRMGVALTKVPASRTAGQQLMALAPFLVLGDFAQANALADAKRRFEGKAAGDRWFAEYTARYSYVGLFDLADSLSSERDAAEKQGDFARAFDLQKKFMFTMLSPRDESYLAPTEQMLNWAHFYRLQALDAFSRHDLATVTAALQGQLRNGPPDVTLMEQVWPLVKNDTKAQEARETATARLRAVVEDYPEATQYRAQLQRLQALDRGK